MAWLVAAHISLSADDARGRVAHLLVSLASAIGEATHDGVDLRVLNEDLAEGANVTPFTVSRCLRDWEHAGLVAKRRGGILLRRPELLLAAVENSCSPHTSATSVGSGMSNDITISRQRFRAHVGAQREHLATGSKGLNRYG